MKRFNASFSTSLAFLSSFFLLSLFSAPFIFAKSESDIEPKDAAVFFAYAADRIQREYVEDVENKKLLEGALNGMLMSLDPHSSYLSEKMYRNIKKEVRGEYGGLGIKVFVEDGFLRVISSMDDTPAQKKGLQTDDWIALIDGHPTFGMSANAAAEKLRGKPGSKVELLIRRGPHRAFKVTLTRALIKIKPIKWRLEGKIGYIRITTFNEKTPRYFRQAISDIKNKLGKGLMGFVIDVRNNSGGLFPETIDVADDLLSEGEIVSIRGRTAKTFQSFRASSGELAKGYPIVVLINGGSASASEILAGALQDHRRAIVVGTKSFGKASVQTVIPMTNGGAIKITTARYYTPSGRSIQKSGIMPDIIVEQHKDLIAIEDKHFRESDYQGALTEENQGEQKPSNSVPKKDHPDHTQIKEKDFKALLKKTKTDETDYQLKQALNILQAMSLQKKPRVKKG